MLAVNDAFFQSESLTHAAAAIAFVVAALLLLMPFRRAFRRPVPQPSNMGRLGIVKTLALGQSRQLIVVRRDDVEHLVMIGGPNDLIVEKNIAGAAGRDLLEIDANWQGEGDRGEKQFTPMRSQIKFATKIIAKSRLVLAGAAFRHRRGRHRAYMRVLPAGVGRSGSPPDRRAHVVARPAASRL